MTVPDDLRIQRAIAELQRMIRARYPEVAFAVWQGEDPVGTYLTATVDIPDTDEVTDLIIDRLVAMQVEDALPLYVIPTRPLARIHVAQEGQRECVTRRDEAL